MNYKPIHAWKRKDGLKPKNADGSRNEQKIIKGEELQDEFSAISRGFAGVNQEINQIKQEIDGIEGGSPSPTPPSGGVEEAPEDGLTYGRRNKGWVQIASSGGGGAVDWVDVLNKPEPIKDLAAENAPKKSLISGGRY
jgi:hypothetical protein